MNCKKCNNEIDNDSKFCTYCGEKVEIKNNLLNEFNTIETNQVNEKTFDTENEILNNKKTTTLREFYFSSDESIGKKEFFFRGFLPVSCLVILSLILFKALNSSDIVKDFEPIAYIFYLFMCLFIFISMINISIKRLHDTNNNAWWSLLNLIPFLNLLLLLFLIIMPSKKNIYGNTSNYNLNSLRIFLAILNTIFIFILLLINGFTNIILDKKLNENKQITFSEEQFKEKFKYLETKSFYELLDLGFKGDVDAQVCLGNWYYEQKKIDESIVWFEKASNQGHPYAQYLLGNIYVNIKHNQEKAYILYEKAALQGIEEAQYNLGMLGITKGDLISAKEWFKNACTNGLKDGCIQYDLLKEMGY